MADIGDADYWTHSQEHVRIDALREDATYKYPNRPQTRGARRDDYHAHSQGLIAQLAAALGALPVPGQDQRLVLVEGQRMGVLVEVDTQSPATDRSGPTKTPALDYPQGVEVLLSSRLEDRTERAVVFVADDARPFLQAKIAAYGNANLGNKKRPDVDRFEPIETIRQARSRSLIVGDVDFADSATHWWELWVREPGESQQRANAVAAEAAKLHFDVHPERLTFPDTTVLLLSASATNLVAFLDRMAGVVEEVRRATGTIEPFLQLGDHGLGQHEWVDDLAGRLAVAPPDAPTVCILDSGVAAAHPLIEPVLQGAWAVNEAWGTDDHWPQGGHGTAMVGGAAHGDLRWRMEDVGPVSLTHHVESVKFLPPQGFPPNEPARYGIVTQSAVSLAEIERPGVARTFCLATSTTDFNADSPSSWSGAIDQLASGSMVGERDDEKKAKDLPKRLVLVAAGNTPVGLREEVLQHHSIEDPAQSWNALTVGGYTTMTESPADQTNLIALASANDRSPFSRGSQNLLGDLTPIKPEVLFEAGNMLVGGGDFCMAHPAVSVLGAGSDTAGEPLVPFCATSAATAIAGNFVGQLNSALPGLWPETYRALLVHSAEWPQPMRARLVGTGAHWKTGAKSEKNLVLRDVGFGVPNLRRAIASARSDVTILAQAEIQPFASAPNNTAVFNEMHFYALPWPLEALGALANDIVTMKVTLSYFVEPNLSGRAATRPETYRSFGLRFELKKRLETGEDFRLRLSKQDPDAGAAAEATELGAVAANAKQPVEPSHWLLGPKATSAGSLHCDLWRGYGVELASFNHLAVYPVGGWWKTHLGKKRMNDKARYSLAVSLTVEGQNVDLFTEIMAAVEARQILVAVEIPA